MTDYSTRYFQLTPNILVEYNYANESGTDCKIDVNELGINSVITNPNPYMKIYLVNKNYGGINLSESNFVVPSNKSQTSFVKLQHVSGRELVFSPPMDTNISINKFTYDTNGNSYSLSFDKIRFHFTSRNIMGEYDGLIFQTYIYDNSKNKICLMSFLFSKKDDVVINESPMLINQRLYTSYIDVRIPSVYKILKSYNPDFGSNNNGDDIIYGTLKKELEINTPKTQLMSNTPICINLFGVKHEIEKSNFTYYLTENIGNITIPNKDTFENIYIDISEADDGDYFNIQPKISDGTSFSDYIYKLDENPEAYVILHELKLIEHYVTFDNTIKTKTTHTEQFIVSTTITTVDEHDRTFTTINQDALDEPINYRPICKYGSKCFKFTIEDTLKIINTNDNTTIVKSGSYTYNYPSRYGKKMQQINLTETPSIIHVYNKRTDGDVDTDNNTIRITNGGSNGPRIETTIQNTISFIDGANIVVSIQQIPARYVESQDD